LPAIYQKEAIMLIAAIVSIIVGLLLLWKGKTKQKEQKEQKGFVVLATTLFLIYMFPGMALLIIGLVLIALMGGGCIHF
jgi:hypothetical protein